MRTTLPVGFILFVILARMLHGDQTRDGLSEPKAVVSGEQGGENGQVQAGDRTLKHRRPRYQLRENDVIDVSFPLTPEYNQTITIQPDGYVSLLGVGDCHVAGQTIPEAIQSIRATYASLLHDPMVTIALKDFVKPYFVAGGEVGHPGKYDLRGDTTLVEAVGIAGGFTDNAKHSEVWIFRRVSSDWVETQRLNVKEMLKTGNLREDVHLLPGDMLYVPKSNIGKIRHYLPVATLGSYFNPTP
jgi:polysaccharide export outer membrane protein